MNEKMKKMIVEIVKSDEIKDYLAEIIADNSKQIIDRISDNEHRILSKEIQEERNRRIDVENELNRMNVELNNESVKFSKLESQYNDLKEDLRLQTEKNSTLENELVEKTEKIILLDSEASKVPILEKKVNYYTGKYGCLDTSLMLYNKLSEDTKYRLKNIFENVNIFSFILAASNWDNLDGIWNYSKRRFIEENDDEAKALADLFREMFDIHVNCNKECQYSLISPKLGDKFDSDIHGILGVKTDGIVCEVL